MTLQEIKLNIYKFFQSADQLILPDDRLKIITITETPELHYAAIFEAMKNFEESGLVKKVVFEDKVNNKKVEKVAFILDKPLANYPQTVTINGDVAFLLSEIVNSLDKSQTKFTSNPFSITNIEVETVAVLCNELIRKEYEKIEGGEESD